MVEAITASYAEGEDWTITVRGLGKTVTAKAPGIIAARDRADQLVEKLVPSGTKHMVVHLINGSALEFSTAYITARMTRPSPEPVGAPAPQAKPEPQVKAGPPVTPTKELPKPVEPAAPKADEAPVPGRQASVSGAAGAPPVART